MRQFNRYLLDAMLRGAILSILAMRSRGGTKNCNDARKVGV